MKRKRSDTCQSQQYEQNIALCQTANLKIVPFADSDKKSVTVSFALTDAVKFNNCFPYYDMFILDEIDCKHYKYKLHAYNFAGNNYSYTFKDVFPGLYKIYIQPCYTTICCANLSITQKDLMNVTNYVLSSYTLEIQTDNSTVTYVIIGVVAGCILTIFGLYYVCSTLKTNFVPETDSDEIESLPEKAVVYILHYYDDFNVNKQRGDILKDFLIKTSLYNSVKTIEDELASSLDNVHSWVSDVLKERTQDGRIQKIILIDSKEEDEEGAIENLIFNDLIAQLKNNLSQFLSSYDRLFVVQMNGISGCSDKLENVVRGHRFHIPKHSVDLSLNLYSVSKSHVSSFQKHIEKIYMNHPIRSWNER